MGFMAGFGESFSTGLQRNRELKKQQEADIFKLTYSDFLKRKDENAALEQEQANRMRLARQLAEQNGQDSSAVTRIYDMLDAGQSESSVQSFLEQYSITGAPTAPETAKKPAPASVDQQMAEAGLADTKTTPQAAPQTGLNAIFLSDEEKQQRALDGSIDRIAAMTGNSADSVRSTLTSRPDPVPTGDGTYSITKKDVPLDKLTDAEIQGQYVQIMEDVAAGKPGAEKRLEQFTTVRLPAYLKAQEALQTDSGENALANLIYKMEQARNAGDETAVAMYADKIEAYRRAEEIKSGKDAPGTTLSVIYLDNNKTDMRRVRKQRDEQGNVYYTDARGNLIEGAVAVEALPEDAVKRIEDLSTERMNDIVKHEETVVATADAIRMTDEIFSLVDGDPRVLTGTADWARTLTGTTREVFTATDVIGDIIQQRGQATQQEIEQALGAPIADVEARIDQLLGEQTTDLGERRALLNSKILLAGFRFGGLEGQQGNGLSDRDFANLMNVVNSDSNPDVFKQNWAQYVKGRIASVDARAEIANQHNAALDVFERMYDYRPYDKVKVSLTDYVEESGNEQLQRGWGMIEQWSASKLPLTTNTEGQARVLKGELRDGRSVYETPDGGLIVR